MSDESTAGVDHFDLDEWVNSVEGLTVKLTVPDKPDALGAIEWKKYYMPWCAHDEVWCEECDDYHVLIKDTDEAVGHCPECGRQPGMLELGTTRRLEDVLNE